MYRGRTRHEASEEGMYPQLARFANFRHAVWGPDELFYADLFASRKTGCRGTLGMPGQRDQHTACVGAHCVENDLFDFMLFSLPDNDTYSHKRGPYAQVTSIASADRALERLMHAGGGPGRVPRGPRRDRDVRPLADRRRRPRQPGRGAAPTTTS